MLIATLFAIAFLGLIAMLVLIGIAKANQAIRYAVQEEENQDYLFDGHDARF